MTTLEQKEKIGDGIDEITHAELFERISKEIPTGISKIDGKWTIDGAVPAATKGTIEASGIDLDLEHIDMDAFSEDWTVTDYIAEEIRCHEEKEEEKIRISEEGI